MHGIINLQGKMDMVGVYFALGVGTLNPTPFRIKTIS